MWGILMQGASRTVGRQKPKFYNEDLQLYSFLLADRPGIPLVAITTFFENTGGCGSCGPAKSTISKHPRCYMQFSSVVCHSVLAFSASRKWNNLGFDSSSCPENNLASKSERRRPSGLQTLPGTGFNWLCAETATKSLLTDADKPQKSRFGHKN